LAGRAEFGERSNHIVSAVWGGAPEISLEVLVEIVKRMLSPVLMSRIVPTDDVAGAIGIQHQVGGSIPR